MQTESQEKFNGFTNAKESRTASINSILMLNEKIDGTPFHVTGNPDSGYFLRMGMYRVSEVIPDKMIDSQEPTANKEEVLNYFNEYLITEQYNIILTMIAAAAHLNNEKIAEIQ